MLVAATIALYINNKIYIIYKNIKNEDMNYVKLIYNQIKLEVLFLCFSFLFLFSIEMFESILALFVCFVL